MGLRSFFFSWCWQDARTLLAMNLEPKDLWREVSVILWWFQIRETLYSFPLTISSMCGNDPPK